jgi:tellurite resistance protein
MATSLSATDILKFAAASGAFGGVAYFCSQLSCDGRQVLYNGRAAFFGSAFFIAISSAVMGAASAIGLLFLLKLLELLKSDNDPLNILFLTGISVVAGVGAQRLLPAYTQSLLDRLSVAQKESEEAKEYAQAAEVTADLLATLTPDVAPTEKARAIRLGITQLQLTPLNRRIAILTARLQKQLDDFEGASSTLRTFVEEKRKNRQLDEDYADALYNIACYEAIMSQGRDDHHRQRALETLRSSIAVSPQNRVAAQTDEDFTVLRDVADFRSLTT